MNKTLILGLGAILALASCSKDEEKLTEPGYLQINTSLNTSVNLKAVVNNPNDFKLTIAKKSDGLVVKDVKVSEVGTTPIELTPDTYIVKTSSNNFTTADWDTPLYEATQEVVIASNATATATLVNTQANAGVKVTYTDAFKAKFADYQAVVESAKGNLTYAKTEARTGYFAPGNISIKVTGGTTVFDAITRKVNAKELVNVKVDYSATGNTNGKVTLTITVDNTVTERTEDVVVSDGGNTNPGTDPGTPGTEKTLLSEDFATAAAGTAADASGTLWTPNANFLAMDKAYQAAGSIKLGSSSAAGYLETKVLDLSANSGKFTVKFKVKGWYANGKVIVTVNGQSQEVTFTADKAATVLEEKSITFTNGNASTKVKFEQAMVAKSATDPTLVPVRYFIDDVTISQ